MYALVLIGAALAIVGAIIIIVKTFDIKPPTEDK